MSPSPIPYCTLLRLKPISRSAITRHWCHIVIIIDTIFIGTVKALANPFGAAEDVFPAIGEDAGELEEAMRNARDKSDFDNIFFAKLRVRFEEAEFFTFEGGELCGLDGDDRRR